MATTAIQKGEILTLTAPAGGATSGVPFLWGRRLAIPLSDAAGLAPVPCAMVGAHTVPKVAGTAMAEKATAYWNEAGGYITANPADVAVGQLTAAALLAATTCSLLLGQAEVSGFPSFIGPPTLIAFADSPYAVLASDVFIRCNTAGGAIEVDLPASAGAGRRLIVVRNGGSNVTIDGNGAETVAAAAGGGATYVLNTDGESAHLVDAGVAGDHWVLI